MVHIQRAGSPGVCLSGWSGAQYIVQNRIEKFFVKPGETMISCPIEASFKFGFLAR